MVLRLVARVVTQRTLHRLQCRLLLAGAVLAGGSLSAQAPLRDSSPVDQLFEAYRAGRHDAVWAELARTENWGELREAIKERQDAWPADTRAAFALEAAIVAQQASERMPAAYQDEVRLFEDACRMVRGLPSGGEFEVRWHDVALSLLAMPSTRGIDFGDHLGHIRDRIDPGRWALAAVRPREEAAWGFLLEVQPGANNLDDARLRRGRVNLRLVLDHLKDAEAFDNVRAEATLRRGALLGQWGESVQAIDVLQGVPEMTDDARLRHLALLHLGRAYLAAGDQAGARRALEQAIIAWPEGRSVVLVLASLEFAENHRSEADLLTRRALATNAQHDPWLGFFDAESRALPDRLAALREIVR